MIENRWIGQKRLLGIAVANVGAAEAPPPGKAPLGAKGTDSDRPLGKATQELVAHRSLAGVPGPRRQKLLLMGVAREIAVRQQSSGWRKRSFGFPK
jgi:hypothetical protein